MDYIPLAQDELVRWPQGTTYQALISTPSRVTDDFELIGEEPKLGVWFAFLERETIERMGLQGGIDGREELFNRTAPASGRGCLRT